jgi:phosphoribosylformimino-5-aminoimidazole carboxamide ribotide isomerase
VTIFPAIDLRAEKCVRLRQGDFERETIYDDDPAAVALRWQEQGAPALHLVDLDGAKMGRPMNLRAIQAITQAVRIPCQLGGGLRSEESIQEALQAGARRVILGSQACKDPAWLAAVAQRFPEQLLLGLDAKEGFLAAEGWREVLPQSAFTFAASVSHLPLAGIIYTDIAHDGMLAGPSWESLARMMDATRLPVIASGGVTSLEDIRRLRSMQVHGCIIGRALYEETISLREALRAAGEG